MYINSTDIEVIANAIEQIKPSTQESVFLMLGEKDAPNLLTLVKRLNELKVTFFGGIFPSVIHGNEKYESGAVLSILPILAKPFVIEGLDGTDFKLPNFADEYTDNFTSLVLVDGLTSNISLFISCLYNKLGNACSYIGGGAGSLSLKPQLCLFDKDGVYQDAAIICFINKKCSVGVRHGWEKIRGPFVATRTDKNIIYEINWQNAFQVYKNAVEADSGKVFTDTNFFDIAKGYPFGITKQHAESVVRDPIAVNNEGGLICVGEVRENTVLDILKGEQSNLLNAAEKAAQECTDVDAEINDVLIFDCISRVLFLEENFTEELNAIQKNIKPIDENLTLQGALTLGEISSHGQGYLEFFNKTIVVGLLYE